MSYRLLLMTALLAFTLAGNAHARTDRVTLMRLLQTLPATRPVVSQRLALSDMLATMKHAWPHAVVTGRYHDWRALSIYRSHAGPHYGYDIAMPAGTRVPVAWSGKVVAITPWHGREHGITVQSASAFTTYGHLSPLVTVGDNVQAGQVIGAICIDHVDVKMRDASGSYVDFGAGEGDTMAPPSREQCLAEWLQARIDYLQLHDELRAMESEPLRAAMQGLQVQRARSKTVLESMETLLAEDSASVREVAQARARHAELADQVSRLQTELDESARRSTRLRERIEQARRRQDLLWQACRRAGLSERDVSARLARHASAQRDAVNPSLRGGASHATDWEAPDEIRVTSLRRMYDEGIISSHDLERLLATPATRRISPRKRSSRSSLSSHS